MEDYNNKSIEKILSADELMVLYEMMSHPGWGVLKKVDKAMKEDWVEQTANYDMSGKTDEEMMRKMRHRQGQIKGVSLFIGFLEKKLRDRKKRIEKEEKKAKENEQ